MYNGIKFVLFVKMYLVFSYFFSKIPLGKPTRQKLKLKNKIKIVKIVIPS